MNILKHIILAVFVGLLIGCGQDKTNQYTGYTSIEIETEKCFDKWLEGNNTEWEELQTIFEDYFILAEVCNRFDAKEKQYQDILNFMEQPTKPFPAFKEKKKVMEIMEKLELSKQDLTTKKQLNCLAELFTEHKLSIDTASSYYIYGDIVEVSQQVPDLSPGLLANAINMFMDEADLKKTFYQKTIVLMFCFDMGLHLSRD